MVAPSKRNVFRTKCFIISSTCWLATVVLLFVSSQSSLSNIIFQRPEMGLAPEVFSTDFTEVPDTTETPSLNVSLDTTTQPISRSTILTALEAKVVLYRRPYKQDPYCGNFTKRLFEADTFNTTALVSFPGSGNTWTRHLIELAAGIYTGSVYLDLDLLARGFLGEKEKWGSGSTIAQKTHFEFNSKFQISKAVLLIRDPYMAIVSFVNYLESGHTGQGSLHTFQKKEWPPYILAQTYKWIRLAKSWIEAPVQILLVQYENMRRNTTVELERVCDFLDIECPNLHTTCFLKHEEGSFLRHRRVPLRPSFPAWVRERLDNGIDFLSSLLQQHGHQRLSTEYYPYYRNHSKFLNAE